MFGSGSGGGLGVGPPGGGTGGGTGSRTGGHGAVGEMGPLSDTRTPATGAPVSASTTLPTMRPNAGGADCAPAARAINSRLISRRGMLATILSLVIVPRLWRGCDETKTFNVRALDHDFDGAGRVCRSESE